MILPYSSWQGALQLAQSICDTILTAKIPHPSSPISEYITLSIGVSCSIPDGENCADDLLKNADKALGRNQVNVLLG